MGEKFVCCRRCTEELPPAASMRKFERLSVSLINEFQIRIWCNRHDAEVASWNVKPGPVMEPEPECEECGNPEIPLVWCEKCAERFAERFGPGQGG